MAKRRARGEGSVEALPSGRFRATLPGRKKAGGSQTFDTAKEAREWLWKTIDTPRVDGLTLSAWVEQWIKSAEASTAATNHKRDRQCLDRHVLPTLGNRLLRALNATTINGWLADLHAAGVSTSERRRAAVTLRKVLRANESYPRAVWDRVKIPTHRTAETRHLTPDELRQLLEVADSWEGEYGAMIRVGIDCAARAGELLGLQWGDFDADAKTLTIRRAVCPRTSELKETKTVRSRRTIPLSPKTLANLLAMPRGEAADPLFRSTDRAARPYWRYADWIRYRWWPLVKAAGLADKGVSPKSLRDTGATLLLSSGVNIVTVSRRLGHSTVTQTLNTYGHSMPNEQERAAETIGQFV